MLERPGRRHVALLQLTLFGVTWLSFSLTALGQSSMPGHARSRYPKSSQLFKLLVPVLERPSTSIGYSYFRFAHTPHLQHGNGAVAMAAGAVAGRPVGDMFIRRAFCPTENRSCSVEKLVAKPKKPNVHWKKAAFRVSKDLLMPTVKSYKKALAKCAANRDGIIQKIKARVRRGQGLVLTVYSRGTFKDHRHYAPLDVHGFVVFGVATNGDLLLRDASDRVPISYRLPAKNFCKALVAPTFAHWGHSTGTQRLTWQVTAVVVAPKNVPRRPPCPGPKPPPVKPPPSDGHTYACRRGQVVGMLGNFSVPRNWSGRKRHRRFVSTARPPRLVSTYLGISPEAIAKSWRGLKELETKWGARSFGRHRFVCSRPRSAKANHSCLDHFYVVAGKREGALFKRLGQMFESMARRCGHGRKWAFLSLIRFVQSIQYELIPKSKSSMGVAPPMAVLGEHKGDCDSLSLLAAVILKQMGYKVAVVSSGKKRHAILGVVVPASFGLSGKTIRHGSKQYLLIEMTAIRPPGRVNVRIVADGWKAVPVM